MMNVFTTEQEAINAQDVDFQMYKDSYSDQSSEYWVVTVRWAKVAKREDAEEWFYSVCPEGIQTHEQKQADTSWYPIGEVE